MIRQFAKLAILTSLLAPLGALAEDAVQGTTTAISSPVAPIKSIFPNVYGEIDLRHYFNHKEVDPESKTVMTQPLFQPRFNLGSKFFDGKLDSKFVFSVENHYGEKANAGLMTDRGTRLENDFTVFKNDYVAFIPFLYVHFPKFSDDVRQPTKAQIGIDSKIQYPIPTNVGIISPSFQYVVRTFISSKHDPADDVFLRDTDNRVMKSDDKGLSLSELDKTNFGLNSDKATGNYKVAPKGRSFLHEFYTGFNYKSSLLAGLEAELVTIHTAKFVPVMEYDRETKEIRARSKGGRISQPVYSPTYDNSQRLTVLYKITPIYGVANEFTLMSREDGTRKYANMVSFVAKVL